MGEDKMVTIKQLVNGVNKEYFLPIIQREYRWLKNQKDQKIEKYFDSLYKGYPSGNFVFYQLTNLNKYKPIQLLKFTTDYRSNQICTNPIVSKQEIINDGREGITLIYDGQQRITSMFIALKSGYIKGRDKFSLYFNLDFTENKEHLENARFKFCKGEEVLHIDSSDNSEHVLLKKIYQLDTGNFENFITENNLQEKREKLVKLHKILVSDDVIKPNLYSHDNFTEDQMFTIFARLNSGEPVKREELVLSYFYDYFNAVDFRKKINDLNSSLKNDCKIEGFKPENLIASIMFFGRKPVKLSINDIDDSVSKFVKNNCDNILNCIKKSAEIVYHELNYKNFDNLKLSLRYPVELIGYYLFKNKIANLKNGDKHALIEFIRIYQIKEWNKGNKVTERSNRIRKFIDESENFSDVLEKLRNFTVDRFAIFESDIDAILELKYESSNLSYVLQTLFPHLAYETVKFQVDHIFPSSREYDNEKVNNIANLQFLSSHENNSKNDKSVQDWFNSKTDDEKNALAQNGLLTNEHLDDFEQFFEKRKEIIRNKLMKLTKT